MRTSKPMIHTTSPLAAILALLMSGGFFINPLRAAGDDLSVPHLEVFGTAERQVVPDELVWHLDVETHSEDQRETAERHSEELAALLMLIRESGIEEKDIQTDRTWFSEDTERVDGQRRRVGFRARTEVQFKTSDLDSYAEQWLTLATMSGVNIRSVELQTSERLEIQTELRLEALRIARTKAEEMAAVFGAEIGAPLVVEEIRPSTYGSGSWTMSNLVYYGGESAGGSDDQFAAGTIAMSRQVRVVFALKNPDVSMAGE